MSCIGVYQCLIIYHRTIRVITDALPGGFVGIGASGAPGDGGSCGDGTSRTRVLLESFHVPKSDSDQNQNDSEVKTQSWSKHPYADAAGSK